MVVSANSASAAHLKKNMEIASYGVAYTTVSTACIYAYREYARVLSLLYWASYRIHVLVLRTLVLLATRV